MPPRRFVGIGLVAALAGACVEAPDVDPSDPPGPTGPTGRLRVVNTTDAPLDVRVDGEALVEGVAADEAWPAAHDERGYGAELAADAHDVEVTVGGSTYALTVDLRRSPTTLWVHGSVAVGYEVVATSPSDAEGWPGGGAVSVVHAAHAIGPVALTLDDQAWLGDPVAPGEVATFFVGEGDYAPPWGWLGVGAPGAASAAARFPVNLFDPLLSDPRWLDAGLVGDPDDGAGLSMWLLTDWGAARVGGEVDVVWHNASPSLTAAAGGAVLATLCVAGLDCPEAGAPTPLFATGARVWGNATRLLLQAADGTVLLDAPLAGTQRRRRTTLVSADLDGQHVLLRAEDEGDAPADAASARFWNLSDVAGLARFLSPGGAPWTLALPPGAASPRIPLPGPGPHDVAIDLGANGDVEVRSGLRDAAAAALEVFLVDVDGAPTLLRTGWNTDGPWLQHGPGVAGDLCDLARCDEDHLCVDVPLTGVRSCAPLVVHPVGCAPGTTWVDLSDGDYFAATCAPSGVLAAEFDLSIEYEPGGAASLVLGDAAWSFEPLTASWSDRGGVRVEGAVDGLELWIDLSGTLYEVGASEFPAIDPWLGPHGDRPLGERTAYVRREGQTCVALSGGTSLLTRADRWPEDSPDPPWGGVAGSLEVGARATLSRPEPYRPVGAR